MFVGVSFKAAIKISKNTCLKDENNNLTSTSSANKALNEGGRREMEHSVEM